MKGPSRDHYSYTVYADPAMAASFDTRRFGGPIGELVAASQADVLLRFVGALDGRRIIDVGTGTGRAALLLAAAGASVTGIDASDEMLAVARRRAGELGADAVFRAGDAQHLDVADRAFDVAVSLRVLMHTPAWQDALVELCRVANHLVVFDYPALASAAALQSLWRRAVYALGVSTEPYRVFSDRQIADVLRRAGFRVRAIDRQFVLPIAFHKRIGSPRFTEAVERFFTRVGLTGVCGSPVTVVAERC